MTELRNPAAEASEILGPDRAGRVLEPSPPAVDDEFFADDPINAPVDTGIDADAVVGPIGAGPSWTDVVADQPELADWAAERWLAGPRVLTPTPARLVETRLALHRLATYVIAPARHRANGKFGLRWTRGGFGTPFFGDDVQIRVEGDQLVVQEGSSVRSSAITSLAAAAEFIGGPIDAETAGEHDSPPVGDTQEILSIDPEVTAFLSRWWGMGTAALETVRAEGESVDASRVQLWPGHFDPAIEIGDEDRRASYGASPGDGTSDDPYLYVSAWWPDRLELDTDDAFWNAEGFVGALLPFATLLASDEPVAVAADFFREGRDRLAAG